MNGKKTEKNRSDLHSEIGVNSTAGDSRPLHTLKGIGPKTEELFRRAGIETRDDLLHDYPRDYDACDPPVKPGEAIPGQKKCRHRPDHAKTVRAHLWQQLHYDRGAIR